MYQKILVATDGSELAGKAVEHGLRLAHAVDATVVLVSVTEMWTPAAMARAVEDGHQNAVKAFEETAHREALAILEAAAEKAKTIGVSVECHHVKDRRPSEGIVEVADRQDCDLIIMASHGHRGMQKLLLGSQTSEVLAHTRRPILVLR